jgi:hypothetical protein
MSVESSWHRYCSKFDDRPPSRAITKFYANLFSDVVLCLSSMMQYMLKSRAESPVYTQLCKVHMIKLSYYLQVEEMALVVDAVMVKYFLTLTRI